MRRSTAPSQLLAQIEGGVTGQVAVGAHVLQVGAAHGCTVHAAAPGALPSPRPRPAPARLRPRPFPGLLDRAPETAAALDGLASGEPVELFGEEGAGKTSLLRRLAHDPLADAFPDGVVHLPARGRGAGDLVGALWEAFHLCERPYVPTPAALRQSLRDRRALVILDDVTLDGAALEEVLDAAPACTFLWTASSRRGVGEARAVRIAGLPPDEAIALVERELGRRLEEDELPYAHALRDALEGHPLRLLQAAAAVRDERLSLAEAVARAALGAREHDALVASRSGGAAPGLARAVHGAVRTAAVPALARDCAEAAGRRRLLCAAAAFGGAPVSAAQLAALTGAADPAPALEALARSHLVREAEGGWAVPGALARVLLAEAAPWRERARAHFASWAEARRGEPLAVAADAPAAMALLEWAAFERRWSDVLRLGRAVEGPLALAGRMDAWERVLAWMEEAGRHREDRAAVAFALHQRGTRAGCLGADGAGEMLGEALRLRTGLGDTAGAEATRRTLDVFFPPIRAEAERQEISRTARPPSSPAAGVAATLAGIAVAAVLAVSVAGRGGRAVSTGTGGAMMALAPVVVAAPPPASRRTAPPRSTGRAARAKPVASRSTVADDALSVDRADTAAVPSAPPPVLQPQVTATVAPSLATPVARPDDAGGG